MSLKAFLLHNKKYHCKRTKRENSSYENECLKGVTRDLFHTFIRLIIVKNCNLHTLSLIVTKKMCYYIIFLMQSLSLTCQTALVSQKITIKVNWDKNFSSLNLLKGYSIFYFMQKYHSAIEFHRWKSSAIFSEPSFCFDLLNWRNF